VRPRERARPKLQVPDRFDAPVGDEGAGVILFLFSLAVQIGHFSRRSSTFSTSTRVGLGWQGTHPEHIEDHRPYEGPSLRCVRVIGCGFDSHTLPPKTTPRVHAPAVPCNTDGPSATENARPISQIIDRLFPSLRHQKDFCRQVLSDLDRPWPPETPVGRGLGPAGNSARYRPTDRVRSGLSDIHPNASVSEPLRRRVAGR